MLFNINQTIKVRLNEKGYDILREKHNKIRRKCPKLKSYEPPPTVDGWSEWQLWDFMQTFGPYVGWGKLLPFEADIRIG